MSRRPRLLFVIPAYNEERQIGHVLKSIGPLVLGYVLHKVIVVNDGSTDRTREVVAAFGPTLPIVVIDHDVNRGPGAAFHTGFRVALDEAADDDVIVTMEADGVTDASILPLMLQQIEAGSDVSIASCYAPAGRVTNVPIGRRWLSRYGNLLVRTWLGMEGIHTCTSFFRAYRCTALQGAFRLYGDRLITEPGFVAVVEVLAKAKAIGCRLSEVPAALDWGERRGGSKLRPFATMLSYVRFLVRWRYRRASRLGWRHRSAS